MQARCRLLGARSGHTPKRRRQPHALTETGSSVTCRPLRGQDKIGRARQVGACHRASKMSNAQWRRWQWRTERRKERQLQTRPIHRRGSSDSPLVARGYSCAPRAEQALPMTTEMTDSSMQGQRTLTCVVTFVKFDLQEQIPFPHGVLSINCRSRDLAREGRPRE